MSNSNKNSIVVGSSLSNLLTVAFVVLKLTKVINWSWWWVLSPIWIQFALGFILLIMAVLVAACDSTPSYRR